MRQDPIAALCHDLRSPLTAIAGAFNVLEAVRGEAMAPAERRLIDVGLRAVDQMADLLDDLAGLAPVAAAPSPPPAPLAPRPAPPVRAAEGTAPVVLIVDDSLTVRMDLRETFEAGGFGVATAASAAEARAALARTTPAVIVLDRHLPDADGLALLAELKAEAATAAIPVMLLSGEAEVGARLHGLGHGAEEYVGKPYDRPYLVQRARELATTPGPGAEAPTVVLLIDDRDAARDAMAARLAAAGYRVVGAASGEEGLRLAALRAPDVLVTAGHLPGMGGALVIRRLRLDPRLRRVPCLVLTRSGREADVRDALEAGADVAIPADADPGLIVARLASLVRSSPHRAPGEGAAATRGARRVLVLGDPADASLDQLGWTREEGYDLVHAGSLAEALAFLGQQPAACLVIAFADGPARLEACREVRATLAGHDVPLVVLVPDDDAGPMLAAYEAGAEDCVVRGLEPAVARERLRALLRRKRLQDEERDHAALEVAMLRAEAATRAKTEFLAHMSHEIRTPLTALVGMADLLGTTPLSPEQERFVAIFRRAGDRLRSLVNDLLDLSKIEAGELVLEAVPFDLTDLLAGAVELATVQAQARGLAVRFEAGPGMPPEVIGDPGRLRQVLDNLLANAVKFTERGEVGLRVRPAPERGPTALRLEVHDTGIGIAPDQRARIFDRFTQADSSTSRRFGGTGLGLAIARELVARMGGTIEVASEVGCGSTFVVTLDLAPAPAAPAARPTGAAADDGAARRILLAEDSADNRMIFEAYFAATPFRLDVVPDGAAAVRRFTEDRFDLVLMDMQMPVLDGYEATRAIRRWEAAQGRARTPIVALTAFALLDEVAKTRAAGCDRHLTKPITRAALLATVRDLAAAPVPGPGGPAAG